ncbi:peptidylprolyl isomerase [Flavobacterium sp.]|uniref:peptidylprolyl isomerase n=1 Tax=Flavobacterium sp. TaxID=239 RepID=UPI003C58056B
MKKNILYFLLLIITCYSCKDASNDLPDGLYAKIDTNKGEIILELNYIKAPITVANFVTLAEGKNNFVTNDHLRGKPFYDGLKFHRVINDFMIQTGDPLASGAGGAGYKFKDEITDLKFDGAGVLAMANNGIATNSSQFFITHLTTPWLEGKHTIFGHVVGKGMEVVNQIQQNDVMKSVTIIRKGEAAKKFNAEKTFYDYFSIEAEKEKKKQAELSTYEEKFKEVREDKANYFSALKSKATRSSTGLKYVITKKASGQKPKKGTEIYINYAGFLEDGKLFDSNIENVAQTFGKFDPARAEAKQYLPIPFQAGRKDGMIPGFIEGLEKLSFGDKAVLFIPSHLAYGAGGAGDVIPPNANIIFEIELLESQQ